MTISDVFLNSEHRLRALWRVLFFSVLLVFAFIAVSGIAILAGVGDSPVGLLIQKILEFTAFAVPTAIAARVTEQRSFGDVGFGFTRGWFVEAAYGVAFGSALLATTVLPAALAGRIAMVPGPADATLAIALVFFAIAAAGEELLCRGFMLQAFASGMGKVPATILMSALFAFLHGANDNVTVTALVTTFVAGLLLSIAYFRTGNLWLATGLHFGWNIVMGYVLGLPVSGLRFFPNAPVLLSTPGDPSWLTGGEYGPEGAEIAVAVIALGCVALALVPLPRVARGINRES